MKIAQSIFFLILFLKCINCYANEVANANDVVSNIDQRVKEGEYQSILIKSESVSEGVLPTYQYYHDDGILKLVSITVGHETWNATYFYYFWDNGNLIKYLRIIEGRPDDPGREAMIYDKDGNILWKNTERLPVNKEILVQIFDSYFAISNNFKLY